MMFLHDVWVNWFEGEESGFAVCSFHEWRKTDPVELIEQVPVIKVSTLFYETVENTLNELPSPFLNDIYQQAYIRKNKAKVYLENCAIVTDGKRVIVIDSIGYKIPIRKSRLVPRQEQQVLEMAESMECSPYIFCEDQKGKDSQRKSEWMEQEKLYLGLTRRERQLKQILLLALDQIRIGKNVQELRYWFTEWFPEKYNEVKRLDFEEVWEIFYQCVAYGWSQHHVFHCEKMIRGQKYLEQLWEIEMDERPTMK